MRTSFTVSLLAVLDTSSARTTSRQDVIKGVSYGPLPLKSQYGWVPADDWFCSEAVPMWGEAGRGDLRILRQLGANMVRLYGNNPEDDHTNFLDEAAAQGLSVAPGMSDYPYSQMGGSCLTTDFNCFTQIKPMYSEMLRKGFLTMDGRYHPALKYMNVINEPDLKMPAGADTSGLAQVYKMCRAIISAFDAMLDAEREAAVSGPLINFTTTFSFGVCTSCEFSRWIPALAQMAQLEDAMRNPEKYGYKPRNDILAAYESRWTHSFNTANPALSVKYMFLNNYEQVFTRTPVYIAEYHSVGANQTQDLDMILDFAEESDFFLGISFFQFQIAYRKAGTEREFGMFGLGDYEVGSMPYFGQTYPVYCLTEVNSARSGVSLSAAVAGSYKGSGVDASAFCVANPLGVPLNATGYLQIVSQKSASQMSLFIERLVHGLGAVVDAGGRELLERHASKHSTSADGYASLESDLRSRPQWVTFDTEARCVADRSARPDELWDAIRRVCSQGVVDCDALPVECNSSSYRTGDFVFSHYFRARGDPQNPRATCDWPAIYAPSQVYAKWTGCEECSRSARRLGGSADLLTPTASTITVDDGDTPTSSKFLNSGARRCFGALFLATAMLQFAQITGTAWGKSPY